MRTMKVITDPEAFQLLGDETRRKMTFLLRVKPMTVSQIAVELGLSPQTVYHHIQKLRNVGIVEVVKEERVGHLIESYFQTTAEVFHFTMGECCAGIEYQKKLVKVVVDVVNRLGFNLKYDDETAQKIADVANKSDRLESENQFEEKISKFTDVDFLSQQVSVDVARLISASEEKFNEILEAKRLLRKLYLSMSAKNDTQGTVDLNERQYSRAQPR